MGTAEIKLELFRKLDQLEPEKLNEAYNLFISYLNGLQEHDEWDGFSSEQKEHIETALLESDKGLSMQVKGLTNSLREKYNL